MLALVGSRSGEMREQSDRRTDDTESLLPDSMGSGEMRELADRGTDDTESMDTDSMGSWSCYGLRVCVSNPC